MGYIFKPGGDNHSHSNIELLNSYDQLNSSLAHSVIVKHVGGSSHANKALLDTYTQTESDIASAIALKHNESHSHTGIYEPYDADIQIHINSSHAPYNAQKNSDILKSEIEDVLTGVISSHSHAGGNGEAFPVGSVFLSVVDTNPNTLLGYGNWSQIAQGKFLVGQNVSDAAYDVAEETGGNISHTHDAHPALSHANSSVAPHSSLTHSGATVGDHAAKNTDVADAGATQRGSTTSTLTLKAHVHPISAYSHSVTQPDAHAAQSHTITQADQHAAQSHSAANNIPPYFVVYAWKRVS